MFFFHPYYSFHWKRLYFLPFSTRLYFLNKCFILLTLKLWKTTNATSMPTCYSTRSYFTKYWDLFHPTKNLPLKLWRGYIGPLGPWGVYHWVLESFLKFLLILAYIFIIIYYLFQFHYIHHMERKLIFKSQGLVWMNEKLCGQSLWSF